jgi:hypothetical protein
LPGSIATIGSGSLQPTSKSQIAKKKKKKKKKKKVQTSALCPIRIGDDIGHHSDDGDIWEQGDGDDVRHQGDGDDVRHQGDGDDIWENKVMVTTFGTR